jgi:sugar phosphate permease
VYVPTLKIFSIWFRKNEYATISGMLVSLGNIGGLIAATPLALMIVRFGWQPSVITIGTITVLLAGVMYTIVRNTPKEMDLPSLDEIDNVPADQRIQIQPMPIFQGIRKVLSNPYFWPMAIRSFTSYGVLMSFQSLWGGPYLMQVLGQTKVQAGSILMMLSIGSIITPPIGGYLSDKVLGTRKGIVLVAAILSTLCWLPIAFFPDRITPSFLYVWLFIMGAVGGLGVSGIAMLKELFPASLTGTVNGMSNFFTMMGGALYTLVMGIIIGTYPKTAAGTFSVVAFSAGFRFLFISMMIGTIAVFFAKETKQDTRRKSV